MHWTGIKGKRSLRWETFNGDVCKLVPIAKLHSEANRKLGQLLQSLHHVFQMLLPDSPYVLEMEEREMYQSLWALSGCLCSCCAFLVLILSSFSSTSSSHIGTHSVCRATSMGDRQCQHFTHRAKFLCGIKTCKLSMKPRFPFQALALWGKCYLKLSSLCFRCHLVILALCDSCRGRVRGW